MHLTINIYLGEEPKPTKKKKVSDEDIQRIKELAGYYDYDYGTWKHDPDKCYFCQQKRKRDARL